MNLLRIGSWSLRRKLVVACVLVQLGAMALVLFAGSHLMQRMLEEQAAVQERAGMASSGRALAATLPVPEPGPSAGSLQAARDEFRIVGVLIVAAALAVSVALLAAIAYALTRNLAVVAEASREVAAGRYDIALPVHGRDEVGRLAQSFNSMAADIKQRMLALQESERRQQMHLASARAERARLTTLLGALRSGILFVDARQRVVYANAMFCDIWSLRSVPADMPVAQILPALRQQATASSMALVDMLLAAAADAMAPPADGDIALADGRLISQRMHAVGDGDHGAGGCIWLHQDVTLDRQTQQRARLALVDPLTDLLNRRGLFEALHAAIGHSERTSSGVSLLCIDLDDFKHANDVAGHWAGDQILVLVARVLAGQLQPDQQVARMGSDEFAVIAPGNDAQQLADLAGRLVQTVSALRFEFDGNRIRIGCSIGVAMVPLDAGAADQLVACADRAMHQAKLGGKNGYCLYQDDAAHARAEFERVSWNGRIFGALRDHRLQLHFQPVHRVSDLGIVYYEALVRMVDEDDATQLIGPTAFVPHAERSGKIRQIDRWVFQACIDKLAQSPPSVCIAANLSARSLDDPGFADFLRAALRRSDVDPRRLHIELTETAAMGDMIAARPMIAALRAVGCAVHLDDFGSGFSSFEHLKLLEVDGIKIDGSFIRDLTSDPSNQLVVASLINIARSLNKTTVAECVEDAATLDALRELGVDHVQGFHLGRPARKLAERVARDPHSAVAPQRRSVPVSGA